MGDLTGDLLGAVVAATPERKELALKFLRGELTEVPRPATGPVLMGMGAAAKYLGVSRATLWRAMRAGKIQRVELFAGSYRVRREDLEALALRRCSGQAAGRRRDSAGGAVGAVAPRSGGPCSATASQGERAVGL